MALQCYNRKVSRRILEEWKRNWNFSKKNSIFSIRKNSRRPDINKIFNALVNVNPTNVNVFSVEKEVKNKDFWGAGKHAKD